MLSLAFFILVVLAFLVVVAGFTDAARHLVVFISNRLDPARTSLPFFPRPRAV